MKKDKVENNIRRIIDEFLSDGDKKHLNELSPILLGRDADSHFLKDLFGKLCGKSNLTFRNFR